MKIILVTLCIFLINLSFAQREPIDLARQLLSEGGVIDTANFYSDELDLRPRGITGVMMSNSEEYQNKKNFLPDFTDLISNYDFKFRQFPVNTTHQIINVTATDSLINGFDFYLHFKKEGEIWKLTDLQRLNHGIVADLWMVNYTDYQVDSIVNSDSPYKVIRSKEQFESIKELYNLTMNFDDSIISYFV